MDLLPFTRCHLRIGGSALALSLCFLSACAPPPSRFPTTPAQIRVSHNDPAHDAQARMLQEAHRAFVQGRYPAAALFFNRFIDGAKNSPHLAEARWWLGRAYEQLGERRAAMAQYRLVAAESPVQQIDGLLYEGYALRRLDEMRRPRSDGHREHTTQLALRVTADQLPLSAGLAPWLQELAQAGVTVLALTPVPNSGHEGVNFEAVRTVAGEAHRLGLLLWVVLDLHQGQGIDVRPEWMAATRHRAGHEAIPTLNVDIAHPAYQSSVEEMVRMLARTGCDGVLLAARSTAGFAEEFSDDSRRLFAAAFGFSGTPEDFLLGGTASVDTQAQGSSAAYWRWVGWKARSYAQLAVRLRKVLRERNQAATLSVEVHESSLVTPLQGLEQFGEDVAELSPRTGGSLVVRQEGVGGEAVLEKLDRELGTPDRVWIEVSVKTATRPLAPGEVAQMILKRAEFGRWNIVLHTESVQSVP